MDDNWRDIPGYEGLYSVNIQGDIKSHYHNKILKPSVSTCGYKQCVLYKDKQPHIMNNHRAVALAFKPTEDQTLVINHKDENKLNCSVDNLEWVTRAENNAYMGNRAAQAIYDNNAKEIYVYDIQLNYIETYLGINRYAKEHNMSRGNLATVINKNQNKKDNYATYRNLIFLDHMID